MNHRGPSCAWRFADVGVGLALWIVALLVPARALEPVTVRSHSGQFTVRGVPLGPPPSGYSTSTVSYLRLDPSLTAVSLDRIRQAIGTEFGLNDRWRSPVHLITRPMREDNPRILITSVHYTDGWGYRLDVPEIVDKPNFLLAAVRVILLEMANRNALTREAELPPWLAIGMVEEIQVNSLPSLALEPETAMAGRGVSADSMRKARALLRKRPALTFSQLSLPDEAGVDESDQELYAACAHVLVHELLRLRGGPEALRDMLNRLPENLNWQTTFLRSFSHQFQRLIDVDKWYALSISHLTGRERLALWPVQATLDRLDEILATAVQVRVDKGDLPIATEVKTQRILSEWEFERQAPVLEEKMKALDSLHLRAAADLLDIIREYQQAIDRYIYRRSRTETPSAQSRFFPANSPRFAARDAILRLDALDRKLDTLRGKLFPSSEPNGNQLAKP